MKTNLSLKDLLISAGKKLRSDFEYIKSTSTHGGKQGGEAEDKLIEFLNIHLPQRFKSTSGFVIDFDGKISSQCDIVIYDALNSPIYKSTDEGMILLSDNVASVIEVKSTLNKEELKDAAEKIASVKSLRKSPLTDVDQPVTFSSFINTKTYGVVFAYNSQTTLETLAENLREINKGYSSFHWIDMIVVLDKGVVGYTVQNPFNQGNHGWFGGPADDEFPPPPYYIHLAKSELGELTLNKFFVDLLAHLTFYRQRVGFDFNSLLGPETKQIMTIHPYQYNLSRELVDTTEEHTKENFSIPIRYNLFKEQDKSYIGQIGRKNWQDGAMLTYSGFMPPHQIFPIFVKSNKAVFLKGMENGNHWITSVISLTEKEFEDIASNIDKYISGVISQRDSDDDNPLTAITYQES